MTNWKNLIGGVAVAAISSGIVLQAEAQVTTSAVRGTVVDQNGAAVENASAKVTHLPSGTVSSANTNESGVFAARGLRVGGPYKVELSGEGFAPVQVNDLFIALNETYPVNLVVNVSETQATMDTIVITATQLDSLSLNEAGSTVFGQADINRIANVDRDIADVAQLSPFANINTQSSGVKEVSIAGANNRYNSLTIDGIPLNDRFGLNSNGYPTQRSPIPYDAIDQLQLQVAPMSVESNGFTGGTINAVTKSGTNEFHGSVFYDYSDDSMIGDTAGDEDFGDQEFEEKAYGFTLGGPIVKDKLFFFGAYEKFEQTDFVNTTPADRDITQAQIDQVASIVQERWGFDVGANLTKPPVEEEKYLLNLDWNINNDHRLKLTHMHNEGSTIIEQNGNNFLAQGSALGLTSAWYNRSEEVDSYVGQFFSDWTDSFSTELKVSLTKQDTGQSSLNGADFPSMAVGVNFELNDDDELEAQNSIVWGPDRFRHGNELSQEFLQVKAKGTYIAGDHTLTFGFERETVDADNLFAQNSEGSYYFEDINALIANTASGLLYNNAVTNDENDLRAKFSYAVNSIYLQDTWNVLDNLSVSGGLRLDTYSQTDGKIRTNQNFIDEAGFTNAKDYDDLDSVLLPRLSFDWQPSDVLTVRGGVGRFSGGSPNVWISNSFSNDGVISDNSDLFGSITVPVTPDATTGQYIPTEVLDSLANTAPNGDVNALDPSFEIPTTWKVSLGAGYELTQPYVEGWNVSADVLYNVLENQPYWYNAGCDVVGVAPEGGRAIYDCSFPEYLAVGSADKGNSFLMAFAASKDYDNGISLSGSYTYQDIQDIGMGTSSTATSNYSDTPRYDYQVPTTGTSNFETEHAFKLRTSYEKAFFGDYMTTIAMSATYRSGRPYSYTFDENNNCVFDDGGGRCARESRVDDAGHLLYVPTGVNDPYFSPNSFGGDAALQQEFFDYIESSELAQYRGGVAERNGDTNDWTTIVDLRLKQELPGAMKGHKSVLFFDIENVGNLLNSDWGVVEVTEYEYERSVVRALVEDGQYVYSNLKDDDDIKNLDVRDQSLWKLKLGVRYEF